MMKTFIILLLFLSVQIPAATAHAHGVVAGYSERTGIEITARYDSGQPMAQGQVVIFAPDNPARPWKSAFLDEHGVFFFVPDKSIPGNWSVQVRQAGHGAMIHIPVGEEKVRDVPPVSAGPGPMQLALMIACVVWGSIGTALYFSKRKI